jgi:hypothetical protein
MHSRRGMSCASSRLVPVRRAGASGVDHALTAKTDGPPVLAAGLPSAPLAALAGGALAARFLSWSGASGRRYICSIFPGRPGEETEWMPHYSNAIVIAVAVHAGIRRIEFVTESGERPERFWDKMKDCCSITEFHLHLLARTAAQRRYACADLSAGHGCQRAGYRHINAFVLST